MKQRGKKFVIANGAHLYSSFKANLLKPMFKLNAEKKPALVYEGALWISAILAFIVYRTCSFFGKGYPILSWGVLFWHIMVFLLFLWKMLFPTPNFSHFRTSVLLFLVIGIEYIIIDSFVAGF